MPPRPPEEAADGPGRLAVNENAGQGDASAWSPEEKAFFLEFIGARRGERVLDLGCGNGVFSGWLRESGCRVVGADFSFAALRRARGLQELSACCELPRLPFRDASFDRVVCIEVLEHLSPEAEQASLRAILRVLKPGGSLALHTSPNEWAVACCRALNPFLRLARFLGWTRRPLFGPHPETDAFHINKHTPPSLRRATRAAGFDGEPRPYTSFCTFPWRWTRRAPWLEHPALARFFGLRFRGLLRRPRREGGTP
jgi:SAM-dependent methyltransferase